MKKSGGRKCEMEGQIDSSFTTEQRDLFASGLVAEIGVNAYAVWQAIKFYADFTTGEAFPGMRTVGAKLGLSPATVHRAIKVLEGAKMLRVTKAGNKRRGQTYIARERMRIMLGGQILCTIVVDYVPNRLRQQINRIEQALISGETDPEVFAEAEIIPGNGFEWDEKDKVLKGKVAAAKIPKSQDDDGYHAQLGAAVLAKMAPRLAEKMVKK